MLYKVVLNVDSVGQDILQTLRSNLLKRNLMSSASLHDLTFCKANTTRKLLGFITKSWSVACITKVLDLIEVSLLQQIDFSPKYSSSVISKMANLHCLNHNIDIQSKTTSILLMISRQRLQISFTVCSLSYVFFACVNYERRSPIRKKKPMREGKNDPIIADKEVTALL